VSQQPARSPLRLLPVRYQTVSNTAAVAIVSAAACMTVSLAIHPDLEGVFGACLAATMIWIAGTDAQRFRIPNSAVLLAAVAGLLHAAIGAFGDIENVTLSLVRGLILAAMFAALRTGYRLLRKREGMGFGDVKLAFAAGIWLDWDTAAVAIALASLSGLTFYACHQYLTGRRLLAISRVPFGLFFAPAIWIGWVFDFTWPAALAASF
jgi:leader peptidase (prepilin peptidase)/N-methyltransferase